MGEVKMCQPWIDKTWRLGEVELIAERLDTSQLNL